MQKPHNQSGMDTFKIKKIIWWAFCRIFATYTDVGKFFFNQKANFLFKKLFSYVFEKFYYFSCILRQICYELVIKKLKLRFIFWSVYPDHWQVNVKKEIHRVEWMIFLQYHKYGRKILNFGNEYLPCNRDSIYILLECSKLKVSFYYFNFSKTKRDKGVQFSILQTIVLIFVFYFQNSVLNNQHLIHNTLKVFGTNSQMTFVLRYFQITKTPQKLHPSSH